MRTAIAVGLLVMVMVMVRHHWRLSWCAVHAAACRWHGVLRLLAVAMTMTVAVVILHAWVLIATKGRISVRCWLVGVVLMMHPGDGVRGCGAICAG